MKLSKRNLEYLKRARVARLATVDSSGRPHVVPIVFANSRNAIYFVVDRKKKKPSKLKRVENIVNNPEATLLVDVYSEDWNNLSYLILHCKAVVSHNEKKRRLAARLLKDKYAQYRTGDYFPTSLSKAIFVELLPVSAYYWQNLRRSLS